MARDRRNLRQSTKGDRGRPATDQPRNAESNTRWITTLLVSAVVGPLVVFLLVREGGVLNPSEPAARGGSISRVTLVSSDPCCVFSVKFVLQGFQGQTADLDAVVTDAASRRTAEPLTVTRPEPDAETYEASFTAGVPMSGYPPREYFVTFVLHAPDGTELDRRNSDVVEVP
jgi:hypothetical protein